MKNKKIIILGLLLLAWGIIFFTSNSANDKKKKGSKKVKSKQEKLIKNNKKNISNQNLDEIDKNIESFNYKVYLTRKNISNDFKRDLFNQNKVQTKTGGVKTPINVIEEPREIQKTPEKEKVKNEMGKIKFMGFYELKGDVMIFVKYKGEEFELEEQDELEIFIDKKVFKLKVEIRSDGSLMLYEAKYKIKVYKNL